MFFKGPIKFRQNHTYPAWANATGLRSKEISQAPDSTQGRRSVGPAGRKLKAALLAVTAILALLVPAYGQQEVDATWYDPWAASNKTVVHHAQPRTAHQASGKKINSASITGHKSKIQVRQQAPSDRNRPREVAAK